MFTSRLSACLSLSVSLPLCPVHPPTHTHTHTTLAAPSSPRTPVLQKRIPVENKGKDYVMIASDSFVGLVVVTSQGDAQSGGFLYHIKTSIPRECIVHRFVRGLHNV
jgi:hypothetical protein